jgi:hypothetical protein
MNDLCNQGSKPLGIEGCPVIFGIKH